MNNKLDKGMIAEMVLKEVIENHSKVKTYFGHFIDEKDYFQRERERLIAECRKSSLADDVFVLTHKDELI